MLGKSEVHERLKISIINCSYVIYGFVVSRASRILILSSINVQHQQPIAISLVHPMLEYASSVWDPHLNTFIRLTRYKTE